MAEKESFIFQNRESYVLSQSRSTNTNRILSCAPTERTDSDLTLKKLIYKGDDIVISKFDTNSNTHVITQSTVDDNNIPLETLDRVIKTHRDRRQIITS